MSNQIDLLIMAEGDRMVACWHRFDGKQRFSVRELNTQSVIEVPAEQISLYRHTLLLNGMAYRILNIFKPA